MSNCFTIDFNRITEKKNIQSENNGTVIALHFPDNSENHDEIKIIEHFI